MMIPDNMLEEVMTPVTHHHTHTHLPIPTVTPDIPKVYHQYSTEVGHKTLWYAYYTKPDRHNIR